MTILKNGVLFLKKSVLLWKKMPRQAVGMLLLCLVALLLLWSGNANSIEAVASKSAQICFEGEYRIGDGPWQKIVKGQHIPATKGDVTLRGHFHSLTPEGDYMGLWEEDVPIALYTDHINLMIHKGESEPYVIDNENPLYGFSACGESWTPHSFGGGTDPIEMVVRNPHRFGNASAVDDLLSNLAVWGGIEFENDVLSRGSTQRNIGYIFIIITFVLLGTALFSTLLHMQNNHIIWLFGMASLCAGLFFCYSAPGVDFWNASVVTNTTVLGISMLLYMLSSCGIITCFLEKTRKIANAVVTALGCMDTVLLLIPMIASVRFFDTWAFWVVVQTLVNAVLLGCLIRESTAADRNKRWIFAEMALLLIAFEADVMATAWGWWKDGIASQCVFIMLFIAAMIVVWRIIPESFHAAAKAKELEMQRSRLEAEKSVIEAELKESRVSLMLSQIQPHFIYNTLGTIERLCLKDPEKAFELVRNFSLYLRGNFSELDSVTPIQFTEELKHVEYYVNIERVRFPDMSIAYEVETTAFVLPALSVQPLVENAIKHGLMRLETAGTVVIRSWETSTHYCVEVRDDGAGFDTALPIDRKKHVGLYNIRERLQAMVNGELILQSEPGVGTKAVIMIPKEAAE